MKRIYAILVISFFILGVLTTPAVAEPMEKKKEQGKITLDTDELHVEIVGNQNVPKFSFSRGNNNDSQVYQLKFDRIFEAVDDDGNDQFDNGVDSKVSGSNDALSSYSWVFSDFDIEGDSDNPDKIHFNMTSDGSSPYIQFRMHIDANNPSELKFDVIIDNYEFKDDSAMFVIAFKLMGKAETEQVEVDNENEVNAAGENGGNGTAGEQINTTTVERAEFGEGFFESINYAEVGNETVVASLSTGNEGNAKIFYLSYGHFEGRLVHDPTIGVGEGSNFFGLPSNTLFAALGLSMAAIVIMRKRH